MVSERELALSFSRLKFEITKSKHPMLDISQIFAPLNFPRMKIKICHHQRSTSERDFHIET